MNTSGVPSGQPSPAAPAARLPTSDSVGKRPRRWERKFLEALALTGNVSAAARLAGIHRDTAYATVKADPGFAARYRAALEAAADGLRAEARRRAVEGVSEPVVYDGELVWVWVDSEGRSLEASGGDAPTDADGKPVEGARRVPLTVMRHSDSLLIRLLRAHCPEFADKPTVGLVGAGGGPVEARHEPAAPEPDRIAAILRVLAEVAVSTDFGGDPAGASGV
jgi:hypothetical protein